MAGMVRPYYEDPFLAFNFLVEIKEVVGGFTEISGLKIETEVKEYREGGVNKYIHKLAGPTRYPSNLILKHGLTSVDLWDWYQKVMQGSIERKNVSIVILDNACEEKRRWNFENAYPVRWSGPDLRAGTAEVAVETIELVHCGLIKL
jgi:phage tail-like protein